MTGGWGKTYAAILAGAAATSTATGTADAQVASASSSSTTAGSSVPAVPTTAQNTTQARQAAAAQGAQPVVTPTAQPPALAITGSIRTEIDYDDNGGLRTTSPGSDFVWATGFDIGLVSRTPTDELLITVGADLQFEDLAVDREENGIDNEFALLNYTRNGPDSRFSFDGRIRNDDIIDSIFIDTNGDLIDDTLLESAGSVQDLNFDARYSFGIQAPFGMDFRLSRRDLNYSDVISPDLNDEETLLGEVAARFRINPTLTARAFLTFENYEADDPAMTDRDTTDFGVGVTYDITPDLRFDGQLAATEVEESLTFGGTRNTTTTDGVSAQLSIVRDLPNGTAGVSYGRDQFANSVRNDYTFDRTMLIPGGTLSYSVGFSTSDTGDTEFIGSLDYLTQLPDGVLTASLERGTTVNVDNEEVTRTIAGVNYTHNINQLSSLDFGVNLAMVDDSGFGAVGDTTRADFTLGYRYQVTRDWDWTISYVGRYSEDTFGATGRSNAVVTSFGRSFTIRP